MSDVSRRVAHTLTFMYAPHAGASPLPRGRDGRSRHTSRYSPQAGEGVRITPIRKRHCNHERLYKGGKAGPTKPFAVDEMCARL
jgi:hypothetical protein